MRGISILHPIDFGIFPGTISFACGMTIEEIKAEYKKQGCDNWTLAIKGITLDKHCAGIACQRVSKGIHYYFLILPKPFHFTDDEMVTLAHECLHLVQFRLNGILDRDREFECEAYLHSHLMTQILKALRS